MKPLVTLYSKEYCAKSLKFGGSVGNSNVHNQVLHLSCTIIEFFRGKTINVISDAFFFISVMHLSLYLLPYKLPSAWSSLGMVSVIPELLLHQMTHQSFLEHFLQKNMISNKISYQVYVHELWHSKIGIRGWQCLVLQLKVSLPALEPSAWDYTWQSLAKIWWCLKLILNITLIYTSNFATYDSHMQGNTYENHVVTLSM